MAEPSDDELEALARGSLSPAQAAALRDLGLVRILANLSGGAAGFTITEKGEQALRDAGYPVPQAKGPALEPVG